MSSRPPYSVLTPESQRCSSGVAGPTPTSSLELRMEFTEYQLLTVHVSQTAVCVWQPETPTVPTTSPRTPALPWDQQIPTEKTCSRILPQATVTCAMQPLWTWRGCLLHRQQMGMGARPLVPRQLLIWQLILTPIKPLLLFLLSLVCTILCS